MKQAEEKRQPPDMQHFNFPQFRKRGRFLSHYQPHRWCMDALTSGATAAAAAAAAAR